jgi:hypothetical protein
MKVHSLRQRYLKAAEDICARLLGAVKEIEPASQGKKGLVFFVSTEEGDFVLRLYNNSFYFMKTSILLPRVLLSGVSVEVLQKGWHFQVDPLVFGYILEEKLKPIGEVEPEAVYDFFYRLGRLHGQNIWNNTVYFAYLWRKWLRKTKGTVQFIGKFFPEREELLKDVLGELINFAPSPVLSLCHRDVAPSNMGRIGLNLYLFDWDRASLFFPLYELSQGLYFLAGFVDTERAVKLYLKGSGLEERYVEKELRFFQAMFAISKIKKLIKRKKLEKIDYLFCWLENLVV